MRLPKAVPPLSAIATHNAADAAKLGMDLGGMWDKILAKAIPHGLVPPSISGKITATALLSIAGAFVDWNLGRSNSAWAKVFKEVSTDSASELGARMFKEAAADPAVPLSPAISPMALLLGLDPAKRSILLAAYAQGDAEQQELLRKQLVSLALPQLSLLADMSDPERAILLGIVTPPAKTPLTEKAAHVASDIKKEIEGGLDTLTDRLRRFTQSRQERQRKE